MINYPEPQYISNVKKGDSVNYGNKRYRIQNDKGWLHIVVQENDKRIKPSVKDLLFEYGTEADYIFNGWFEIYSYEDYKSYTSCEINWLKK